MDIHKKSVLFTRIIYILLIILIGIMSIIPDTALDKVSDTYKLFSGGYLFHILGYGVFCFFALLYNITYQRHSLFIILLFITIYRIILEVIQYFLQYQTCKLDDILESLIGIAVGVVFYFLYRSLKIRVK
ncbi:MAG: VanZ family protein [Rikenellaceae bacterium MAG02]